MAKVNFNRIEDSSLIDQYDIEDGNFWITGDGKTFIDYDNQRIPVGGTPDTEMSDRSRNAVENNVVKKYIDDSVGDIHIYSTDETDTGNKWINNEPIYRKVIQCGQISSAVKNIAHDISNLNTVISIYGMLKTTSGAFYKLPRVSRNDVNTQIGLYVTSSQVVIEAGSNANFADSFVIIEYTKTTE